MIFWNIAGIREKDEEFWEYITGFDIIGMTETWLEEKEWEKWKQKMPKGWRWKCQGAERVEKRGRAKGGIITEVREEIATEGGGETKEEGVQERRAKLGESTWRIVTIYNREGCTEKIKKIEEIIGDEEEEGKMIIGGDFNARIGEKGYREEGEEKGSRKRKTKDRKKNKEGEELEGEELV